MSTDLNIPSPAEFEEYIKRAWQQFHDRMEKRNNWYRNWRDVYQFVFTICVPVFLVLFGVLGNSLSVAVLKRRKMSSATMLLITLAVVDSVLLVLAFLFEALPLFRTLGLVDIYSKPWLYYMIAHYLAGPLATATETFECCTMVVLGVDR